MPILTSAALSVFLALSIFASGPDQAFAGNGRDTPPPPDRPGRVRPSGDPPAETTEPPNVDWYFRRREGQLDANFFPPARPGVGPSNVTDIGLQNPRLGLNFTNYDDLYPEARAAGSSHDRVTFSMAATQPAQGRFYWAGFDKLIAAATARNIQVLGALVDPPAWAGDHTQPHPVWWVPAGLDLAWNDPGNVWAAWVGATVQRYKANVRAWEVWNEPNLEFWGGTAVQYARLLKVTYQAIKAADPGATVVFGGIYKVNNFQRVKDILSALKADPVGARSNYFFDVFGLHVYDAGICEPYDLIGAVSDTVRQMVGDHPVWVTESGIRVWPTPNPGYALPNEQASFLIQNYTYALYAGVQRFYYWRANDAGDHDQPWGVLSDSRVARPSFTAFQVAASRLPATFAWATREWANNGAVSRITFYGTPLGKVSVIWNISATPQRYELPATLAVANVVRPDATTATMARAGDKRTFNLPPAPNFRWAQASGACQVASEPLIITERDTTAPTTRLSAVQIGPNLARLTWQGYDPNGRGDDGVAGIWSYDVQMRVNRGAWTTLAEWQTGTTMQAPVWAGNTYTFRVRARDRAGNEQTWTNARVAVIFAR